LILLFLTMTLPVLREVFGTSLLTLGEWAFLAAAAGSVVPVLELGKWLIRRRTAAATPGMLRNNG